MKHYLLSIQQPDGPPPSTVDMDTVVREVAALEREMKEADVWVFNDHLQPPSTATVVQVEGDDVRTTDGPYVDGDEHIGGLSIIKTKDLDDAVDWGRKLTRATRPPVEIRPFMRAAEDVTAAADGRGST
jgi:hypothetical protein